MDPGINYQDRHPTFKKKADKDPTYEKKETVSGSDCQEKTVSGSDRQEKTVSESDHGKLTRIRKPPFFYQILSPLLFSFDLKVNVINIVLYHNFG